MGSGEDWKPWFNGSWMKATFLMADVNATLEPLKGRLTKPLERTTIAIQLEYLLPNSYALHSATSPPLLTVLSMTAPVYDLDQEEPRFRLVYIVAPHIAS